MTEMASDILDLRNSDNHKKNNQSQMSDILDMESEEGAKDSTEEEKHNQRENYYQEYEDIDPADKLFEGVDNQGENLDNPGNMDETARLGLISWASPDRHEELISHNWRKAIIVILVGMAFLSLFWQDSVLTAVTFFALALVTSMHFWREPREEQYEIHPHGVVVGGKFHHYHDLDSFWIHYHPQGYHELSLCTGKLLNHYIKIPLGSQDALEIRDALMMYLPEQRHEEGVEDWLRRKLGL